MGKKYNIFWFIIDSVRTFRSGVDDRDWLDVMDEFAKDSVHFTNAVTGAPSSKLAAGAMFSGLPTPFVARHFNDWEINAVGLNTIRTLVEKHGYYSYSLLDTRNGRENYQKLLPPIKSSLLPESYRLSDYVWSNNDITFILKCLLEKKKIIEPFCATFWYDCRRDPLISSHVSSALDLIKKNNLYENSIIIMMSDHGYPDPNTNINEGYFRGVGHDMILTDDNIKTPLLIKYPNSPEGVKIENVVGHIDILPTIYDILDLEYTKILPNYQGTSLLPLINGNKSANNRLRRTDTRLPMDVKRMVSLRTNYHKYIFTFEDKSEFLFDLMKDPEEMLNVRNDPNYASVLSDFRKEKNNSEIDIFSFHKENLLHNANMSFKSLRRKNKSNKVTILVITKAHKELLSILIDSLSTHLNYDTIDVISLNKHKISSKKINKVYFVEKLIPEEILKLKLKKYSIMLYLTPSSKRVFLQSIIESALKTIVSKQSLILDYNFKSYNFISKLFYIPNIKLYFNWDLKGHFYKQEPIYFIKDVVFFLNRLFMRIFRKERDVDIIAAKEIIEFRNYNLKANKSRDDKMDTETLDYEFDRIKTREE